jgi:cytoskeletal protein CcmA (bactofilin family)
MKYSEPPLFNHTGGFDVSKAQEASVLGRSKHPPIDKIETVIGPNTNFKGTIVCDGSVRIDGVCEEGSIKTLGNIVVGPTAKVGADLIAENVSVSGAVTGNITASGRLEILSTGKVWGNVNVGSFLLDEEGYFNGKLVKRDGPEPPTFSSQTQSNEPLKPEPEGELAAEKSE